uniref:Uncharacterized protein n=1 Tax=Anguilla anguilla TaxID=7936 RepID=A0A0E9TUE1_ANGAN
MFVTEKMKTLHITCGLMQILNYIVFSVR